MIGMNIRILRKRYKLFDIHAGDKLVVLAEEASNE
jgi:hypothetical protein